MTHPDNYEIYEKSYPQGVAWDMELFASPVDVLLSDTAHRFGKNKAFSFMGKSYTWQELHMQSLRLAKSLQDLGAKKGMKIGICLPNMPYFLVAYYAIARTGATIVNFNPLYAANEIRDQLIDSEVEIMITADLKVTFEHLPDRFADTNLKHIIICPFKDALGFPKNILFSIFKCSDVAKIDKHDARIHYYPDLIDHADYPADVTIDIHNDVALLQYTGGTTGTPKGAMLTHANVTTNVDQAARWFSQAQAGKDKMLAVIPFFHVFAMTAVMNLSVRLGFTLYAIPRFNLVDTLKMISKHKPQFFPAVPAIYTAINNHPHIDKYDLTSLKYCVSGGAPLPVEVRKKFEDRTGCNLVEGYGLTESSPIVTINSPDGDNPAGSIGLPLPQTLVKLVDPDDPNRQVGLNEPGELCVKGPQVMKGYWKRPKETALTIQDGWLHTGDIATMDERGYLYIVDRIKDLIITNGYNVYPRHVEEAIYEHPSVEECIVAGIPDEQRGEIVKAWIKLKDGKTLSSAELKDFLEDRISVIEQPRKVEFRKDGLPKTMIGKLSRKDVVAQEKRK